MPTRGNRHRFLPVSVELADGSVRWWGPEPKPLTGRERRDYPPADAIYAGRGTPLGNPFHRESFGDDALGLYRVHLAIILGTVSPEILNRPEQWAALCHKHGIAGVDDQRARSILARSRVHDPAVLRQLRSIGTETLVLCSCSPKSPCHVDVILKAWAWMLEKGLLDAPKPRPPERVEPEPETPEEMVERLRPDRVSDERILAATHELAARGVNPATWKDSALIRWYEENLAADRDRDARTAAVRHPLDE